VVLILTGSDMQIHQSIVILDSEQNKLVIKIYEEICINIRVSDDISFKLLGLVPLLSGTGAAILTLSKIWTEISSLAIVLISLIAAFITFGLLKWEMRNVQKCEWLIKCAAELEETLFNPEKPVNQQQTIRQFAGWSNEEKPLLFGKGNRQAKEATGHKNGVGKSEAERIIYWTSISAWLIPIVMASIKWKL
jgi:hypothetical protein